MAGILTIVDAIVTPDWLAEHLGEVVVADCRWTLGQPGAGRCAYEAGHIPGAVHLDVDEDLSGPPGDGRHPLPSPGAFAATCVRAGIGAGSRVVAYDEGHGGAARLWWLLRHFGHTGVHVLDGDWSGPLELGSHSPDPPARPFVPAPRTDDVVSAEEIGEGGIDLVDARAPDRFRGEREPVDPVAGHIPGARNVPFTQGLGELERQLSGDSVVYCGSGVTAARLVLASGGRARLYPGGWSQWSERGLPVATGDPS
jgi:thiosulfate/3-mercaptopyruvate sulfurtransferase